MTFRAFAQASDELLKRHAGHSHSHGETEMCQVLIEDTSAFAGARISAIFVVLIASAFGAFFPVLSSRYTLMRMPSWCFFVAKFFGLGVIVATAFMHLLAHASHALGNTCLGGVFTEYPMAFAIALMSLFAMFFGEIISHAYLDKKLRHLGSGSVEHRHSHFAGEGAIVLLNPKPEATESIKEEHLIEDIEVTALDSDASRSDAANVFYSQLLAVFVLEFGVLFHSVFVGLALAVAGKEFISLYIVIVFHQMFEGLGLGTRIALIDWPRLRRWTPWLLCTGYTFVTPIAIAIGLAVRKTYDQGLRAALITNGVFDSISAGILFYTGLIELMAHEFFYSGQFEGPKGAKKSIFAFLVMASGAALMALLGKWA